MNPDGSDQKILVNDDPGVRLRMVARFQVGRLRPHGRLVRQRGVPHSGRRRGSREHTRYATHNGGITWSQTGNKLAFIGQRRRHNGVCVLSLQKPAAKGAPAVTTSIGMTSICSAAAGLGAEEAAISPDGTKVAFRSSALAATICG